jgi:hypothetical protein
MLIHARYINEADYYDTAFTTSLVVPLSLTFVICLSSLAYSSHLLRYNDTASNCELVKK